MEKTFLFSDVFVVSLSLGLMWGCQRTAVGPNAAAQKETCWCDPDSRQRP
jgi:hypothetical protein